MDVGVIFTLLLCVILDGYDGYITNGRTMFCTDDDLDNIMYLDFDEIDVLRFDTEMKGYVMEALSHRKVRLLVVFDDGDVRELNTWDDRGKGKRTSLTLSTWMTVTSTVKETTTPNGPDGHSSQPPPPPPPPDEEITTSGGLSPAWTTDQETEPPSELSDPTLPPITPPSPPGQNVTSPTSKWTLTVALTCTALGLLALCLCIVCLVLWRKRRALRRRGDDRHGMQVVNAAYDDNAVLDDQRLLGADLRLQDPVIMDQPRRGDAAAGGAAAAGDDEPVANRTRSRKGPGIPPYMPMLRPYRDEELAWPSWDEGRRGDRAGTPGSDDSGLRKRSQRAAAVLANEKMMKK